MKDDKGDVNIEDRLVRLRGGIDEIDQQIQSLIYKRVNLAGEIGKAKQQSDCDPVFYRPEREAQVLRKVRERNQLLHKQHAAIVSDDEMVRLMREIMSVSLAAEMPMTVSYLGPEGTYTQAAVLKHFGQSVRLLDVKTIADVFKVVEAGRAHFGVVPVENSTEGVITSTLDCFTDSHLKVCGEVHLPINHQLLSNADGLSSVQRVYAHPQALAQCRAWLERYLPEAKLIATNSNSEATIIAKQEQNAASIAGEITAKIYHVNILVAGIEDEKNNTTRFLIIGNDSFAASGLDKTTFMISTENKAGSLFDLLKPLYDLNVDMSRIESRPSRQGNWEYVFFIDLVGHIDEENVRQALDILQKKSAFFRLIGSYPVGAL